MTTRRTVWMVGVWVLCGVWACGGDDEGGGGPGPGPVVEGSIALSGLYADLRTETLAEGVMEYAPRFELWSDGAEKRRWLYLPPGTQIDTSDMDGWVFPVGTRAYKEFTRDGVRVETRMLEKVAPGEWASVAYLWDAEGTDAIATQAGARDVLGTMHDVPDEEGCGECHGTTADTLLGVSAIQLDHDGEGATVVELVAGGWLTDAPAERFVLPGDAAAQAGLGYLHANCGNCHTDGADNPLRLWLEVGALATVEGTPAYVTTVGEPSHTEDPLPDTTATALVEPGDPDASQLYIRMQRRGRTPGGGMPWLGSELVDDAGSAAIADFIRAL
jgi:mono/diheme cytochrome c family protein